MCAVGNASGQPTNENESSKGQTESCIFQSDHTENLTYLSLIIKQYCFKTEVIFLICHHFQNLKGKNAIWLKFGTGIVHSFPF